MEGLLGDYGYKVFTDESRSEEADIWVVNTCTVKNPSQNAMSRILRKGKELRKGLVVAGCVPQGDRHLKELDEMSLIGVNQIDRIVEVVEETAKGNRLRLLSKKELPSLDLPKVQHSGHILLHDNGSIQLCWELDRFGKIRLWKSSLCRLVVWDPVLIAKQNTQGAR